MWSCLSSQVHLTAFLCQKPLSFEQKFLYLFHFLRKARNLSLFLTASLIWRSYHVFMCMYTTDTQISPEAAGREKSSNVNPRELSRSIIWRGWGWGISGRSAQKPIRATGYELELMYVFFPYRQPYVIKPWKRANFVDCSPVTIRVIFDQNMKCVNQSSSS